MNKIMLGKIVALIDLLDGLTSNVISDVLMPLKDLAEKLSGDDGEAWLTALKRFLRKEVVWAADVVCTMFVDCAKGFKILVAECGNNWVDGNITAECFPIASEDGGEWEYDLWNPEGSISSQDAVERMKGDDVDNPWIPARLGHLLVFGRMNPDAQRKNPIVALGSVGEVNGDRRVVYLYRSVSLRGLDLFWWAYDWGSGCRFLRVRKVKKS